MIANADTVGAASHGGGSGGGGAGAALPGDGQPNTGGGGGGAGFGRDAGGNGGSGIVVARYVINTGPEANAGADVTATEGQEITLLGTASDPDDNITSISWTQTAGTTVTLTDANILQPGFTATAPAGGAASEDLVFQITVTDAFGLVTTDSVTITLQGQAELSVTKTVRVFSESGSACDDLTAAPPDTGSLPATAIPGACMEYTITITNTGPVAAEQITLRDELPADLTLSAAELRPDWAEGTLTLSPDCPGAGCVIEVEGGRIAAGATARVIIRAVLR
ncbi:MAG: DUF11 domain-containing protein [Rhodobacteraceae bacterium]|nr:MAG: DUF11 domain-containing protein [Paracoccaceae bacterium]